jgi:type III restriction enzyme
MEFVDYIREAAQDERGSDGNALPKEAQLVVFPGMELTLSVPCQAIIIFDAELPKDMFSLAFNSLAIRPNDPDEEATAPTKRLDLDLRSLHETLDKHEFLQGRYTVLPNVSEGALCANVDETLSPREISVEGGAREKA